MATNILKLEKLKTFISILKERKIKINLVNIFLESEKENFDNIDYMEEYNKYNKLKGFKKITITDNKELIVIKNIKSITRKKISRNSKYILIDLNKILIKIFSKSVNIYLKINGDIVKAINNFEKEIFLLFNFIKVKSWVIGIRINIGKYELIKSLPILEKNFNTNFRLDKNCIFSILNEKIDIENYLNLIQKFFNIIECYLNNINVIKLEFNKDIKKYIYKLFPLDLKNDIYIDKFVNLKDYKKQSIVYYINSKILLSKIANANNFYQIFETIENIFYKVCFLILDNRLIGLEEDFRKYNLENIFRLIFFIINDDYLRIIFNIKIEKMFTNLKKTNKEVNNLKIIKKLIF